MSAHRSSALLAILMFTACLFSVMPGQAQDDMDLDNLMSEDPESTEPKGSSDGGDDDDGDGDAEESEGSDAAEAPFDNSMVDEERPPVDEDAFVKPKDETASTELEQEEAGVPFSLAVLIGYGFNLDGPSNAWGFGLGARGGYDLGLISLGLRFAYYLGETKEEVVPNTLGILSRTDVSRNFWELTADVGLDLDLGKSLTIRPGLGIGFAALTAGDDTTVAPTLAPGLTFNYNAGETVFAGLEARYQIIAAESSAAGFALLLGVGMRF